jgi:hypothetical protein
MKKISLSILILICSNQLLYSQLFNALSNTETGIDFVNYIQETKQLNITTYEYLFNGAGVAIGDINNDGLLDVYFSATMTPNKLFLNQGNLKFKDITKEAGVDGGVGFKTGVTMVDINNDGWMDIYVCKSAIPSPAYRVNSLYVNNKNGTFTERAKEYGLADSSYSTQAYFYDMDKDGDLDMYLLNHPYKISDAKLIFLERNAQGKLEYVKNKETQYVSDRYYENVNGKYVDKTKQAGLLNYSFGLSAIISDFNQDGFPDIYVCNDYVQPDNLYINNKNGTYSDNLDEYFSHLSYNSMGSDYADVNNDGYADLLVLDMLPETNFRQKQMKQAQNYDQYNKMITYGLKSQYVKNVLQLNNHQKKYSDIAFYAGLAFTDWSWAPLIADFDNDGYKDIYITNGLMRDVTDMDYAKFEIDSLHKELNKLNPNDIASDIFSIIPSQKISNYFFKNQHSLVFKNATVESGLNIPSWSNGAAYADLDNDGDLDIVVNNINDQAFLFRNNSSTNSQSNFIRFECKQLGTKIEITTPDANIQTQEYMPTKGYLSCHEPFIHFGIGQNTSCTAKIVYPNQQVQTITINDVNKIIKVKSEGTLSSNINKTATKYFKDITSSTGIKFTQKENEYIDYKLEPLLPKRLSQLGPSVTVGDINGDKLEDFIVGGAAGFEAVIFIQEAMGKFSTKNCNTFSIDKKYEDIGAKLVDIDNDGDLDLIVATGGNEFPNQKEMYPIRLYINDGKGNFSRASKEIFPEIYTSAKAIAVGDINKDGDMDIFIGGRTVPGHYGLLPESYLLKNEHGKFTIDNANTELNKAGMITDAVWFDYDGDSWDDLVIVGEWMPITIFKNTNGNIQSKPTTVSNTNGWWSSIHIEDINKDGKKDIVYGNYGLNTRYKCSESEPMTMYVSDFDKNGSTDCIINVYNLGISYPIAVRDNVLDQMVFLKKKYLRYQQYATTTINEMLTSDQRNSATIFKATNMKSMIAYNSGGGKYTFETLPEEVQFSPLQAVNTLDINQDGNVDLLLSGNDYSAELETGRNDAGIGVVLSNAKTPLSFTGYYTPGDVKDVKPIQINGKQSWVVVKNQGELQIISVLK